MCDYSLTHLQSRPAKVDDELTVKKFGVTTGFCAMATIESPQTVVCLLPGTEIAFAAPILYWKSRVFSFLDKLTKTKHRVARFRQINLDNALTHHDALELPDGEIVLVTLLAEGQVATVLQLPAAPKTKQEAKEQKRLPVTA